MFASDSLFEQKKYVNRLYLLCIKSVLILSIIFDKNLTSNIHGQTLRIIIVVYNINYDIIMWGVT